MFEKKWRNKKERGTKGSKQTVRRRGKRKKEEQKGEHGLEGRLNDEPLDKKRKNSKQEK